jgi:integrase
LLEYADDIPLQELEDKRPVFPDYLSRSSGLSVKSQAGCLEFARELFTWAKMSEGGVWQKIKPVWVDSFRLRRSLANSANERTVHEFWELEDVLTLATYQPKTLLEERTRAAACFLFLSGMRITAFMSLPVACVDIQAGKIEQKPSKGVVTKNRKAAVTFLLPIPDLLKVVIAWDKKIRESGCSLWCPPFSPNGYQLLSQDTGYASRRSGVYRDLRALCEAAKVEYHSPHKFRHGHGVYGVRHAKTVEEFKSLSQNMMHGSIQITDEVYGALPEENIKRVIETFQEYRSNPSAAAIPPVSGENFPPELLQLARLLLAQMGEINKNG